MPTLELNIDATGMQRGAQQAEAALKGVATTAERTATSVQSTGRALSNTFQVTQGGVQIATGIGQTAAAFQSLNLAAAGFVGARTLLEIGQTATQLSALRVGAGAASGAFLALGRAIPYVGLALSVGTALYAAFGGRVADTTKKINEQVDALGRLQSKIGETVIRAGYGQADPRRTAGGTVDALTALRLSDTQRSFSATDAAALFGVTEQELRYALARSGLGESALEYAPGRADLRDPRTGRPVYRPSEMYQTQSFTRQQIIGAGENLLSQRQRVPGQPWDGSLGGGGDPRGAGGYGAGSITGGDIGLREQLSRDREESAQQLAESMRQAAAYAASIGASLGAGVFDVLAGIQSWRQALANIVGSFAKQGLSDLGASLLSSAFKPTAGQITPRTPGVSP